MTTRAEVLTTLRRLGYPVGVGDLAEIMDHPRYAVAKVLHTLFFKDQISRAQRLGYMRQYVYWAKEISA